MSNSEITPYEPGEALSPCVCRECKKDFVYPTAESEPIEYNLDNGKPTHWEIVTRCGNCHDYKRRIVGQTVMDMFDKWGDHHTNAIRADLRCLAGVNMEAEAELFAAALDHDAIMPEDFGHPSMIWSETSLIY